MSEVKRGITEQAVKDLINGTLERAYKNDKAIASKIPTEQELKAQFVTQSGLTQVEDRLDGRIDDVEAASAIWDGILDNGPVILTQPKSVTVEQAGDVATFRVGAVGNGLTYQWYYITPTGNTYPSSSGKNARYQFTVAASYDGRKVYCVVTDEAGRSATSEQAKLAIGTDPDMSVEDRVVTLEAQVAALNALLAVTASDDGKILGVKDGTLQLLSLDELPLG